MNKKRIISIFLAFSICCTFLVVPSFATPLNVPKNMARFISAVSDDFTQYLNGSMSLSDFLSSYGRNLIAIDVNNVGDITCIKDVVLSLEKLGIDVPESWTEWYYETNIGDNTVDDSMLNGYGALLRYDAIISKFPNSSSWQGYIYCDYITVKPVTYDNGRSAYTYCPQGNGIKYATNGVSIIRYSPSWEYDYLDTSADDISVFGDVRYVDGTSADDIASDLPELKPPNLEDAEEDDLIDFLRDLLDELLLQYPDLSNVEGLLRAILAKLATLDSDDDSDILNLINGSIITLSMDNHADNQQIITLLTDLKNHLTGEGSEDEEQKTTDLSEITKNLEDITKSLDYLCSINTLDFVEDIVTDLIPTATEQNFLESYATLITSLISKFGLATVEGVISSLNSVIFNTAAPDDITVNVMGSDVTILSRNMFNDESIKYINLAKTFVSVLILYSFALMLRRRLSKG